MACNGEQKLECVRGYHVFQTMWTAAIGEELVCTREATNAADRYAITIKNEENVIGHLTKRNFLSMFGVLTKRRFHMVEIPYAVH